MTHHQETRMTEQLRWDHDRMIGESYKDYAIRMRGNARAAELDRDRAVAEVESARVASLQIAEWRRGELAELEQLRNRRATVLSLHQRAAWQRPNGTEIASCSECHEKWPCPTVNALGGEA